MFFRREVLDNNAWSMYELLGLSFLKPSYLGPLGRRRARNSALTSSFFDEHSESDDSDKLELSICLLLFLHFFYCDLDGVDPCEVCDSLFPTEKDSSH